MAQRLVLHIGTMKSGTSFVQSVLTSHPEAMTAQGFAYTGERFGVQFKAVREMLSKTSPPASRPPRWHTLVDSARAFDGHTAVVSMEFLSFARPNKVAALLAPTEGLQVDVVLTVRDQFGAIPAQFQTSARNFGTDDWQTYLRMVEAPPGSSEENRSSRTFHRAQDVATILTRWATVDGVANVTAVTVPPSGSPPDLLWQRFSEAIGLDPVGFNTDDVHGNESIGLASCDYLRRLNTYLADVRPPRYREGLRPTIRAALAPLRSQEGRAQLDRRGQRWAAQRNADIRSALRRRSIPVVGSLDDLPVTTPSQPPPPSIQPPAEQVLRAADAVITFCADELGETRPAATDDLDEAVHISARLLRRLRGWDDPTAVRTNTPAG